MQQIFDLFLNLLRSSPIAEGLLQTEKKKTHIERSNVTPILSIFCSYLLLNYELT
jgi:hypothetical protein